MLTVRLEELMAILFLVKQWMPELRWFALNVPIVLVGTHLGEEPAVLVTHSCHGISNG